jgi:hypothetical protein
MPAHGVAGLDLAIVTSVAVIVAAIALTLYMERSYRALRHAIIQGQLELQRGTRELQRGQEEIKRLEIVTERFDEMLRRLPR